MSDVEEDVGGVGLSHLLVDGAADDVAGGQVGHVVVVLHEGLALPVDESGAGAA